MNSNTRDIYELIDALFCELKKIDARITALGDIILDDESAKDGNTVTIDDDYSHLEVNVPPSPPELVINELSNGFCGDCWTRPCVCQDLAAQRAKLRSMRHN